MLVDYETIKCLGQSLDELHCTELNNYATSNLIGLKLCVGLVSDRD